MFRINAAAFIWDYTVLIISILNFEFVATFKDALLRQGKKLMKQVNKNILKRESCWYIGLTNGGVKSTETRVTEMP